VQQLRTMEIVKREYLQGPSKEGRDRQEAAATLADFAGLEPGEHRAGGGVCTGR
jgi:hypothetical protein